MSSRYSTGRARKRVKVAHRMTPYDYALRSVIVENSENPPGECKNIFEGEALMENVDQRAQYYATQRHVHSDQRAVSANLNLQQKLQKLRFAGFAVTGYDHKTSVYEQGFMSTIGGVNTVMNTGDKALEVGKEIYVLPTQGDNNVRIQGIHANKNVFAVVQAKLNADNNIAQAGLFADAVIAAAQLVGIDGVNDVDTFNGAGAADKQRAINYLRKFCVGTCIRGGRKGQPVDVVLHANANILAVS